jgi:hypothetical protein
MLFAAPPFPIVPLNPLSLSLPPIPPIILCRNIPGFGDTVHQFSFFSAPSPQPVPLLLFYCLCLNDIMLLFCVDQNSATLPFVGFLHRCLSAQYALLLATCSAAAAALAYLCFWLKVPRSLLLCCIYSLCSPLSCAGIRGPLLLLLPFSVTTNHPCSCCPFLYCLSSVLYESLLDAAPLFLL